MRALTRRFRRLRSIPSLFVELPPSSDRFRGAHWWLTPGLAAALLLSLAGSSATWAAAPAVDDAADGLKKTASWQWPEVAIFEQQLLSYLDQREASETLQRRVQEFWQQTADANRGPQFLDRLLDVAALIEPRIAELNRRLRTAEGAPVLPGEVPWLTSDVPGWLQDTIRLASGRALAQRRLYDEALETLSGLELPQVCDPASLLFYRAASEHHLLQRDECLANVQLLLERQEQLPVRFVQLSQLMQADIQPLEQDSLDEVARLMQDVERRLDLGRAGTRVRDAEEQIVSKLDKLIEQLEQQLQQQQQQQQQQQSGAPQPSQQQPMQDSQIAGGSGPGDVEQKDAGHRAGWGNLPPAERKEALQRLTEELPSHYREVIEGYFRQLAKEQS